jgi:hypothetical protein
MNKAERRFQAGPCSATIFANEIETANGKAQVRSVVLQRSFKNNDGRFEHTSSLRVNDVPKAVLVLVQAYAALMERREDSEPRRFP